MFNSNEDNYDSSYLDSKSEKISKKLKILMYCLFVLAVMRIASSQILWMISDLMSALIVYCTYSSKGKIMALFCLINSVMSALYAIIIGVEILSQQKSNKNTQHTKGQTDINTSDISLTDNNLDNYNGRQQDVNLYPFIIVITMIWALAVYCLIAYYSYEGFKYFQHPIGNIGDNSSDEEGRLMGSHNNNYGAVNNRNGNQGNADTWNGQSYRNNGYGLSNTQVSSGGNKVAPFSGRGTVVGGG